MPIFFPAQSAFISHVFKNQKIFDTDSSYMFGCFSYEGDNFVLDQQVVRAALKSYRNLLSQNISSESPLSPSSYYLRLFLKPSGPPSALNDSSWEDPAKSVLLLEWRAAAIVRELAQNFDDPDASVIQRVSKAVTEAFVAVQVGDIINNLAMPCHETHVVRSLYRLVSIFCTYNE
jgi:acyl-CoA oxidase